MTSTSLSTHLDNVVSSLTSGPLVVVHGAPTQGPQICNAGSKVSLSTQANSAIFADSPSIASPLDSVVSAADGLNAAVNPDALDLQLSSTPNHAVLRDSCKINQATTTLSTASSTTPSALSSGVSPSPTLSV